MNFDQTSSLPGLPDAPTDGFSFFESEVGEVFNDIGDIWGSDDGLAWDLELDADFFADPGVAEGLPVNRPEQKEQSMTIPDLAQAVRDEHDRIRDADEKRGVSDKKKKTQKEEQAVWSFDGFAQSSVEPPARHAIKREKDIGLLDILSMKESVSVEPTAPSGNGSVAPMFPDLPPAPKKPVASKKRTRSKPVKPRAAEVPLGSMTGSFLDLLPPRKKSAQEVSDKPVTPPDFAPSFALVQETEAEKKKDTGGAVYPVVDTPEDAVSLTEALPSQAPVVKDVEKADVSEGELKGPDGVSKAKELSASVEEDKAVKPVLPADNEETQVEETSSGGSDGSLREGVASHPSEGRVSLDEADKSSQGVESSLGSDGGAVSQEDVWLGAPGQGEGSLDPSRSRLDDDAGMHQAEIEESDPSMISFDDMVNIIDTFGERPVVEKRVLPPRPVAPETPTNRRGPKINPEADEIEIEDDLGDMDEMMAHFSDPD